ncbi:MAG: four helix bundle protein [Patescibacteria group bacterium]|jgi:four helix bundle protein
MGDYKPIRTFRDLYVYQNLYKAMVIVHTKIVPSLPKEEKFDLADQMKRASKSAPALIAEGFTKRYQPKHWHRYLEDSSGEANEMIHHLSVCVDVYPQYIDVQLCKETIDLYDLSCRQLSKLDQSWKNFHDNKK